MLDNTYEGLRDLKNRVDNNVVHYQPRMTNLSKRLSNHNFDTKNTYKSYLNNSILNNQLIRGNFSIPVWGTETQFSNNGLGIKPHQQPTRIRGYIPNVGIRWYDVYNLEQTYSVFKPYLT